MPIYLEQSFDLSPASPATRDRFVELATSSMMPACERLGARLVGAWFTHVEWYSQIRHVLELDDLAAFDSFRQFRELDASIEALAPTRRDTLLEPLGPVPVASLHAAIEAAREQPVEAYSLAVLEVAPGRMAQFTSLLAGAKDMLPIVASWRPIAGNPNLVLDLWKGEIGREPYRPSSDRSEAFFAPLREVAPRERLVHLRPLPYSPLR